MAKRTAGAKMEFERKAMQSLHLQLPDQLYAEIAQAAAARGQSVESVAVNCLTEDFFAVGDVPESFFTPRILAEIDEAREEARQGGGVSLDEMRAELSARSREWRANHPD